MFHFETYNETAACRTNIFLMAGQNLLNLVYLFRGLLDNRTKRPPGHQLSAVFCISRFGLFAIRDLQNAVFAQAAVYRMNRITLCVARQAARHLNMIAAVGRQLEICRETADLMSLIKVRSELPIQKGLQRAIGNRKGAAIQDDERESERPLCGHRR